MLCKLQSIPIFESRQMMVRTFILHLPSEDGLVSCSHQVQLQSFRKGRPAAPYELRRGS
jgi:hypothetical protein